MAPKISIYGVAVWKLPLMPTLMPTNPLSHHPATPLNWCCFHLVCPHDVKSNCDKSKTALNSVFAQRLTIFKFQTCINARPRLPGEALEVFSADISRLVNEAFPDYGQKAKNGEKFRRFVAGLAPYLQLRIHEQGVTTLDAALRLAVQIERAHEATSALPMTIHPPTASPPTTLPSPAVSAPSVSSIDSDLVL